MNEKINLTKADGTNVMADLICFIENTTTKNRYVYYTLNEVVGTDASATVKIYVSKIKQNNPVLDVPITEEEWGVLKGLMGDALKGNTNQSIRYVPITELGSPVSISERAIAMPTSYDYINKQRGIYATSIAGVSTPVGNTVSASPTAQVGASPVVSPNTQVEQASSTPASSVTPIVQSAAPVENVTPTVESTTPLVTPTPVVEPVENIPSDNPNTNTVTPPIVEEPVSTPTQAPTQEPVAVQPTVNTQNPVDTEPTLVPIDIDEIENKYKEMSKNLENMKVMEIEAAKRYNATIELQVMHNEQHATYVKNEQEKDATVNSSVNMQAASVNQTVTPEVQVSTSSVVEPTPVTPVVPEPAPASGIDIETNWFDLPTNAA